MRAELMPSFRKRRKSPAYKTGKKKNAYVRAKKEVS